MSSACCTLSSAQKQRRSVQKRRGFPSLQSIIIALARGAIMDKFFNHLYSKFLLRDLLGKALPGLLLLIGVFSVFWPHRIWRVLFKRRTNLFPYLLLYGASVALGGLARSVNPWRFLWKRWHI